MVGYFISDQQSDYYNSDLFKKVLLFAQKNAKNCHLKEKNTKKGLRLLMTFDEVTSVQKALLVLGEVF